MPLPETIVFDYSISGEAYSATFGDLDYLARQNSRLAIINGIAIGGGCMLMLLSWVVIVNKRAPIFIMNQSMLLAMVIRSCLFLAHILGPLVTIGYQMSGIFDGHWTPYNTYVCLNLFHLILVAHVEAILLYQIHVVFKLSLIGKKRYVLEAAVAFLSLITIGLDLNSGAQHAIALRAQLQEEVPKSISPWIDNIPIILFSASVNVLCLILVLKLVFAVRTRRQLGLRQFDSFHILIIMASQTFIVPSTLVIANYCVNDLPLLSQISLILAVCNLPLCSIWACSSNNSQFPSSSQNTILSRQTTTSSQETLGHSFTSTPEKTDSPVDLEKGGDVATFCDQVSNTNSISQILDAFEKDAIVGVTTHQFK